MASQFNLVADITAPESIRNKLAGWAEGGLSEDEQERLAGLCEDADSNFMGFVPFVIDSALSGNPEDFAWRAFCDGAGEADDENTVRLYFRAAHDACVSLWEYITQKYPDIEAVRVYVSGDCEYDIAELGEDDLFSYRRSDSVTA